MVKNLKSFFEPKSVVVIGASATPHKPGNDVIKNMLVNEYHGKIYLVNPKGGEIHGIKVCKSTKELPEGIDLGIIILPAKANLKAIKECVEKKIDSFFLAAGGFSEVDEQGEMIQDDLSRFIKEVGIRVIGPNTSGVTSTPHNFTSSFFPLGKIPKGSISYIAQTGNFATHTMRYIITGENFGVARVIGLGNKVDVDENEALQYLAKDDETKVIIMYLESFKDPRQFMKIARKLTKFKPVFLLKGGSTVRGKSAALAHTAALASDDRIIDGALKQVGVVRLSKYSQLFLIAKVLSNSPVPKGNRVGFLAPSGSMLVVLTDLCEQRLGLEVPNLDEINREHLQQISPPYIRMRNPVDIWPAASIHGVEYAYREGMETLLRDSNIDAVVPVLMLTKDTGMPNLNFIVELGKQYPEKPIYSTFSGDKDCMDQAKEFLEPRGIPTFNFIEEPFEILSILFRCRKSLMRK